MGPLWCLNHDVVWKHSVHLSGADMNLGISSLSFPVLWLQQCLLGKGWVQLSWPLRVRAPKLSTNFVLTAFWMPHCRGLWMTFPRDQCKRTVSDTLFCQHVGIIPGFWRPYGIIPAGEASATVLSSASECDPASMVTGSKQLCLHPWQCEECAIVTFGDLYLCSNSKQSVSWKLGGWKLRRLCSALLGSLWTINQKACRFVEAIKWCLRPTPGSRKSSCPGQPVPALAQGLLAWWGRDQISKGDSSQFYFSLISNGVRVAPPCHHPRLKAHVQICVWTWSLMFCYNFLDFHNFTWILLHNLGQLFSSVACLELTCLRNDFGCSSQQILSQPHLAEILELSHTFSKELPFWLCSRQTLSAAWMKISSIQSTYAIGLLSKSWISIYAAMEYAKKNWYLKKQSRDTKKERVFPWASLPALLPSLFV